MKSGSWLFSTRYTGTKKRIGKNIVVLKNTVPKYDALNSHEETDTQSNLDASYFPLYRQQALSRRIHQNHPHHHFGLGRKFQRGLDQQGAKNFAWKMSRYFYRKRCRRKLRTGNVVLGCKIGTTKTNCGRMGNYSFQITPESKIQERTTLQYKNY